jgi:catechol 2,3-dioxygenase
MTYTAHPGTRIGHVHLKVADLDRAIAFYRDVMGFDLVQRYGTQAAFLSAGGYHHHIGLNTWQSRGGPAARAGNDRPVPCRVSLSRPARRWPAH